MAQFSHPWMLWLLAVVPVLALAFWRQARARRAALSHFGRPGAVELLTNLSLRHRRMRNLLTLVGLALLIVACAGPGWGRNDTASQQKPFDLALVLDVSRSMRAEQPSRLERAQRAILDLAGWLEHRGDCRVALILSAAKARLVFPLTRDMGHLRSVISHILKEDLAADLGPVQKDPSGTRLGQGLQMAVETLQRSLPGRRRIVLLSDGDDPAGDQEWRRGVNAARVAGIPINAVGIGDPSETHTIPWKDDVLRFGKEVVRTRLNEQVMRDIAQESSGQYVAIRTNLLSLAAELAPKMRSEGSSDDPSLGLSVRARTVWFLAAAFALLVTALFVSEVSRRRRWMARMSLAPVGLMLLGAGLSSWMTQGNEAFRRGDFREALRLYTEAETAGDDPSLIAFNRAAAHFRLGQYREAELSYRKVIADKQCPPERRARAQFDLGNTLMKQADQGTKRVFEEALAAYRACLDDADAESKLAQDAQHNLELARWHWLKTASEPEPKGNDAGDPKPPIKDPLNKGGNDDPDPTKKNGKGPEEKKPGVTPDPSKEKTDQASAGKLVVLPDSEKVTPLNGEDVQAMLRAIAQRLENNRRPGPERAPPAGVKDW